MLYTFPITFLVIHAPYPTHHQPISPRLLPKNLTLLKSTLTSIKRKGAESHHSQKLFRLENAPSIEGMKTTPPLYLAPHLHVQSSNSLYYSFALPSTFVLVEYDEDAKRLQNSCSRSRKNGLHRLRLGVVLATSTSSSDCHRAGAVQLL